MHRIFRTALIAAITTAAAQAQPLPVAPAIAPPVAAAPQPTGKAFPPPPQEPSGRAAPVAAQTVQQSSYGPANYATAAGTGTPAQKGPASADGIAPLPPLAPPNLTDQASGILPPFTAEEIIRMRRAVERTRKAKAYKPVRTLPRISSATVDLSPGSSLPIARLLPGETSTLLFLDAGGNAWPLATAPRVSDNRIFDVEWLQGTATVVVSALSPYEDGNLSVLLQGFATPVVVKLVTGEPDGKSGSRVVDYRLDLRIPGRAPGSPPGVAGPARIALYDDVMQGFLDGLPPRAAKQVKVAGITPARTRVWSLDGALFVRTDLPIRSAYEQSMAAGDGTRVYKLAPTPFVALSDGDRQVTLQLDID